MCWGIIRPYQPFTDRSCQAAAKEAAAPSSPLPNAQWIKRQIWQEDFRAPKPSKKTWVATLVDQGPLVGGVHVLPQKKGFKKVWGVFIDYRLDCTSWNSIVALEAILHPWPGSWATQKSMGRDSEGYTLNAWAAYDVFLIAFLAAVLGGERPGLLLLLLLLLLLREGWWEHHPASPRFA